MDKIIEYISLNYTWFLLGAIIILLAIIGRYADKTNFGQGKNKELEEKNDKPEDITIQNNITLKDYVNNSKDSNIFEVKESDENKVLNNRTNASEQIIQQTNNNIEQKINNLNQINDLKVEQDKKFEEGFAKLDEEFDLVLPKKQVIDTDLLEDIDSMSLDNTQKISLADIPDLDDVDLPEIKKLKSEQDDIWKF